MSIKILKQIHHTVQTITGYPFFIAGGAVRDTLYGVEPKDYDCVLCMPDWSEEEAFHYLEDMSCRFNTLGATTKVYQSYGLNMGESVNPTSFQAMFLGCMKVQMKRCQLDILISRAPTLQEHVKKHDCNMNMVWFNGDRICWEHGGDTAKVDTLVFNPDVVEERVRRMDLKRHELVRHAIMNNVAL